VGSLRVELQLRGKAKSEKRKAKSEKRKANAIFKSPPLPALSSTKSVEERKKPEQKAGAKSRSKKPEQKARAKSQSHSKNHKPQPQQKFGFCFYAMAFCSGFFLSSTLLVEERAGRGGLLNIALAFGVCS